MIQILPSEYRAIKMCCDELMEVNNILLRHSGDTMLRDRIKALSDDLYRYLTKVVVVVND